MTTPEDEAAALLHRLHLAGVRFPWRGGTTGRYVAVGKLTDADLDDLRRLRRDVLRLLDEADLVSRWEPTREAHDAA
ncbi:MAG: hypothetical protein AAF663_00565 [Planctomycetota bacterium]